LVVAGFTASLPVGVENIELDGQTGDIVVTMSGSRIDGQMFALQPSAGDRISWRCRTIDLEERYLPRECRGDE